MRSLLFFVICIKFSSALLCYECDSEVHGTSCLDPLDTDMVQLVDCKKSSLNTSVAADFECVQSEIIYQASNRQSYLRKCHPRTENLSYCQSLDELGPILGYKLRKCQVCYSDKCNSSPNIKLSLILNLIFFYIFYECTKF